MFETTSNGQSGPERTKLVDHRIGVEMTADQRTAVAQRLMSEGFTVTTEKPNVHPVSGTETQYLVVRRLSQEKSAEFLQKFGAIISSIADTSSYSMATQDSS